MRGHVTFTNSVANSLDRLGLRGSDGEIPRGGIQDHRRDDTPPGRRSGCRYAPRWCHRRSGQPHGTDHPGWAPGGRSTTRLPHRSATPAGQIIGAVLVFRDDTERREYERRLIDSSKLVVRMNSWPCCCTSCVQPSGPRSSRLFPSWRHRRPKVTLLVGRDVLNRQVGHLTYLLDDLLDGVAHCPWQDRPPKGADRHRWDHQPRRRIRATPTRRASSHRLETVVSSGTKRPEADPVRLEQVLVNLLSNAAKLYPAQWPYQALRRVRRRSRPLSGWKTKAGVSSLQGKIAHDLLNRLVQGERTLARTEGGLGIGLTIVKYLVELHVVAASRPEARAGIRERIHRAPLPIPDGGNLRRWTYLPASRAPLAPPPPPSQATRILIIDDNKDLAQSLARNSLKLMYYGGTNVGP